MPQAITLEYGSGTILVKSYPAAEVLEAIHVGPTLDVSANYWTEEMPAAVGPNSEPLPSPDTYGRNGFNGVILTYQDDSGADRNRKIDIRDVGDGTVYADRFALKSDIDDAIADMY